jgi:hypothetical protein
VPPHSQAAILGGDASFFVQAANPSAPAATLHYQWLLNGSPLPGQTSNTLVLSNAQPVDVGGYSVTVSNEVAAVTSLTVALQLVGANDGPPGGVAEDKFADLVNQGAGPASAGGNGGSIHVASLGFNHGQPAGGAVSRGYTGTQIFNTSNATTEQGEPDHCGVIGGASQWFSYQPAADGVLTITTDGSDFDTVLAVYTGPGTDFDSLVSVTCDNNGGADGKDSLVRFNASASTVYYIAVDGVNGASGTVRLNYQLAASGPPRLAAVLNGADFRLRLTGQPGAIYKIEYSADLVTWTHMINTSATGVTTDILDPDVIGKAARFYRASLVP